MTPTDNMDIIGGACCYQCGLQYGGPFWVEALVPTKVWNRIKPEGCADGAGILCISCIAMRLRKIGAVQGSVPIWLCGTEPLSALAGDPSYFQATFDNWDIPKETA